LSNPSDIILSFLIKKKDSFTSGQVMADSLGITRAAIWKAIENLRADGYDIESVKAKGYRLKGVPDIIGEREILPGLKTAILGRKIICLSEVNSTNTYASKLAVDGEPEGTVVVAEHQTAGRGRLGRKWVSPAGVNIYASIILRPKVPPRDAPLLTFVAAVALAHTVRGLYKLDAGIKWPNDLLINGRKAAGILTEMSAEPELVRHIILGVGMDVNMPRDAFPEEIKDLSTSVMLEVGKRLNRAELLRRFLEELEKSYLMMVDGKREEILDEWRSLSITLGRRVKVTSLSGEKVGFARDIDQEGGLILEVDGRNETVTSGDVGFI
jgi:BirA family biotin operon repressor/biotin-[acetyl-CoA-carboxylase] ligase